MAEFNWTVEDIEKAQLDFSDNFMKLDCIRTESYKDTEVNTIEELQDFIELQEDIKREDFLIDFYEVKDYAET